MTPDTGWLASTHAACFANARPWTKAEFAALLALSGAILITKPQGFALAQRVLEQAEILTIAVLPEARLGGIGRTMLRELEAALIQQNTRIIFLEVSTVNLAAQALYYASGYLETGRRSGYYSSKGSTAQDALVLSKSFH